VNAQQFVPGEFGGDGAGPMLCVSKAGLNTFLGFANACC